MFGIFLLLFFAFVVNKGNSFSKENIEGTRIQNADLKAVAREQQGKARSPALPFEKQPSTSPHSQRGLLFPSASSPQFKSPSSHSRTLWFPPNWSPQLDHCLLSKSNLHSKARIIFFFFFFRVIFPKCKCKLFHCFPLPLR